MKRAIENGKVIIENEEQSSRAKTF